MSNFFGLSLLSLTIKTGSQAVNQNQTANVDKCYAVFMKPSENCGNHSRPW